jgi:putative spermidine/putrescine transport system substrate-binding protein
MRDALPSSKLKRRTLLAGAGLLAAPALIRPAFSEEQIILGTWGGDYQRLLLENIEMPLVRKLGVEAVPDIGDELPRAAKIRASGRLPRGQMDVACMQAVQAYALAEAGLLEDITPDKVPNIVHVQAGLGTATFVPHIWSPQILSYSPERVKEPPTSFGDLLDAKYNGKVGSRTVISSMP